MSLKYLLFFGFLALSSQISAASELEYGTYSSGVINNYVDRVLSMIRPAIIRNGFDPFKVDDISQDFWFKMIFLNYTGCIELKNGWLHGISSIYRAGDAKIKYEKKLMTISVDLFVETLSANFDHSLKIFNIGPSGTLKALIKKPVIEFSIMIDFETIVFRLQDFVLKANDEVKITLTGLGLADFIVNIIVDALTIVFKNSVTEGIGNQIRNALLVLIKDIPPLLPPPPASQQELESYWSFSNPTSNGVDFLNELLQFSSQ